MPHGPASADRGRPAPARRIRPILTPVLLAGAMACGPGAGTPATDTASPSAVAPPPVAIAPAPAPASPAPPDGPDLAGFIMPIAGGCLPKSNRLIPNAPRTYRKGVHEGIDFYHSDNCTPINRGTPVIAAKAGRVARADLAYTDVTKAQVDAYLADPNTEASLDQFRGRQVWIDHGRGVVTRYCHLSGIADGLRVGAEIEAGHLIGFVGESGTPSSVTRPGREYHLHFELRVGESYLGHGESPARVRELYRTAFGIKPM
jgi:murein DD-endopeptidase MepM/ murein hydrolase activator NlpD